MTVLGWPHIAKEKPQNRWLKELGKRLKVCRNRLGLTQVDLSERLDVSRQAIGLWEVGITAPSDQHKIVLAALYGVSVDWLLGREKRIAEDRPVYAVRLDRAAVTGEIKDIVDAAGEALSVKELRRIRDQVRFMVNQAHCEAGGGGIVT